jgi:hypothetical protein
MSFFNFRQNNSGGSFDVDETLCGSLYIEADSIEEANEKALELGVYFNGVEDGIDCSCCGDRWHEPYDEEDESNILYVSSYDKSKIDEVLKISGSKLLQKPGDRIVVGSKSSLSSHFEISFETLSQKLKAKSIVDTIWTTPMCRIFYKNGEIESI